MRTRNRINYRGCTLRGPHSGRLNVRIIVVRVYENSGGGIGASNRDDGGEVEYARLRTRTFPVFGVSGSRVLSTKSENAHSR